jgi:hypothetical protein
MILTSYQDDALESSGFAARAASNQGSSEYLVAGAMSRQWRISGLSHEQGWTHVRTLSRRLEAFQFDHFPRGRLEWHSATDQWRLYVDQKLLRGAFITEVILAWHPPKGQLVVRADPQYRSDANIGLPALPRGV